MNQELEEVYKRWDEYCIAYRELKKSNRNSMIKFQLIQRFIRADQHLYECGVVRNSDTECVLKGCIMLTMEDENEK